MNVFKYEFIQFRLETPPKEPITSPPPLNYKRIIACTTTEGGKISSF